MKKLVGAKGTNVARLKEFNKEAVELLLSKLETISPDLGRYVVEFAFGDVLSRPGLDVKSIEIATVAALTALGNAEHQLKDHIQVALNVGCTAQEIIEVIIQMAVCAGFPTAIRAMNVPKTVFQGPDAKRNTV